MAFDPIADTTVGEIRTFFTELCQHWLDLHLEPLTEFPPRYDRGVGVIATVQMPRIPSNIPLSIANQYRYFCDCRHPKTLMGRWKATKAEYLSRNRHMKRPEAQARRIYEIRRQMAHELGWVDKETFQHFETPPGISEEFRPEIARPPWKMVFMERPGMELPILPCFREQRAIQAASTPMPESAPSLHPMVQPIVQHLQVEVPSTDPEAVCPRTESLADTGIRVARRSSRIAAMRSAGSA
ncbi:hypothetical protein V497_01853 [Pseudogymnoascus sp. VKM F-4516 (FW-969)]|nr:hypothetical protein V497_01853 [Pseudogymnoascus sp. VKM F-4516 (FW-969)]